MKRILILAISAMLVANVSAQAHRKECRGRQFNKMERREFDIRRMDHQRMHHAKFHRDAHFDPRFVCEECLRECMHRQAPRFDGRQFDKRHFDGRRHKAHHHRR